MPRRPNYDFERRERDKLKAAKKEERVKAKTERSMIRPEDQQGDATQMTLSAAFDTRRDAEMTVEHLTQEHNIDPAAISIVPVTDENSAGVELDGSDVGNAGDKAGSDPHPALAGKLRVSVQVDDALADKVRSSFATYGGKQDP